MQALSQLSYGPTWRRGTLPERGRLVKKFNDLGAPERLRTSQPAERLRLAQKRQGRIDGRRYRSAANGETYGLRQLAEGDALCRCRSAYNLMNASCRPIVQALERSNRFCQ